jgi:hypothetical protein
MLLKGSVQIELSSNLCYCEAKLSSPRTKTGGFIRLRDCKSGFFFAVRDPDLKILYDDPEFKKLVGEKPLEAS